MVAEQAAAPLARVAAGGSAPVLHCGRHESRWPPGAIAALHQAPRLAVLLELARAAGGPLLAACSADVAREIIGLWSTHVTQSARKLACRTGVGQFFSWICGHPEHASLADPQLLPIPRLTTEERRGPQRIAERGVRRTMATNCCDSLSGRPVDHGPVHASAP